MPRVNLQAIKVFGAYNYYQAYEVGQSEIESFFRFVTLCSNQTVIPTHYYVKEQIHLGEKGLPIVPFEGALSLVNTNSLWQSRGGNFQLFLNFRFLNSMQDTIKLDYPGLMNLAHELKQTLKQTFNQNTATAQKMIMLSEITKEMPNALGLPITKKLRAPLLISTHAKIGNTQNDQVQAGLRVM